MVREAGRSERGPYGRLAAWVLARRIPVGVAMLVLVIAAAVAGLPPRIDGNLLALLPDDDPAALALKELHDAEGGTALVTIAVASEHPAELDAFLDRATERFSELDSVRYAVHELDPELATKIGLLQLRAEEVRELSNRLRGALALGPALNPIVTQRLMDMGPVTDRIAAMSESAPLFGAADGRGRILLKPTGSAHDQVFAEQLMSDVEAILDEELARHTAVELEWVGGAYRHSVEDRAGIESDLFWTTFTSLALVLGAIALGFRSWRATLLVMAPLIAANVITLSLASLVFGSLNTYTSFGTAILLGLGIDFAIHLAGRTRELRANGLGLEDAIVRAWDRVGPACTTAAITSAAAFVALSAASFRGFSQLGLLLAFGLMICLGAMLVGLPVLMPWLDRDSTAPLGLPRRTRGPSRSTYRFAPIGLMLVVIVTCVVGAARLPKLSWEFDLSVLRRGGLAYEELDETQRRLAHDSYAPVIINVPSRAALAREQARVQEQIEAGRTRYIGRAVSLENLLPSDQADRLSALSELQQLLDDPSMRYVPPPLAQKLLPLRDVQLELLTYDSLPEPVVELVGARDDGRYRMLVFPQGNMWDIREASAFADEVEALFPNRDKAGEYLATASLYRVLMRDMPLVAGLALLMVAALTAIDMRKPAAVFAVIGTLLAGLVWAGAAIELMGVKLSMINVVGLPILLGLGIDIGIHLFHRLTEEGPGGLRRALTTTGVAASLSTLTTVLSFVSLTLAGNRGVQSLGILVVIGLSTIFVVSALLLPLAWATGWRVSGLAPGDERIRVRVE